MDTETVTDIDELEELLELRASLQMVLLEVLVELETLEADIEKTLVKVVH